jgi:hypothetical protein
VLQSLVDYRIGNANRWCGITRSCVIRVSINRNPEETDIIKLIERAVQSDTRTFEENFALEEIAPIDIYPRKDPFDISALKEPFTLASYGKERYQDKPGSGTVSFHVSTDVQEAHFNGQLSLYRRLLGYGNHYFYVPYTLFGNRCCDKGVPRKEREKSYAFISGSIAEKSKLPKEVVPVSNCGGLLTEREQDTGMHLHQLVYLKEN